MAPVLDAYKDIVGYWGPVDALHTFCEPKYVTHPKAAEFYNSIGSLIYCVAALAGLRATSGMVWQVTVGWWSILVVGIGSTLFHLTMRYHMELLDELPMLLLIACAILGFHGAHPYASTPRRATLFLCATVGFLGVFTAIYLYTRIFGLFITMFTIEIAARAAGAAMSATPLAGHATAGPASRHGAALPTLKARPGAGGARCAAALRPSGRIARRARSALAPPRPRRRSSAWASRRRPRTAR